MHDTLFCTGSFSWAPLGHIALMGPISSVSVCQSITLADDGINGLLSKHSYVVSQVLVVLPRLAGPPGRANPWALQGVGGCPSSAL
jgi:hypothetical protein